MKKPLLLTCLISALCLAVEARQTQTSVTAISANSGSDHSLFLRSDGSLWGMGYNRDGQLGDGTDDSPSFDVKTPEEIVSNNVTKIVAGELWSLYISNNGSLWGTGYNSSGDLGVSNFNYDYLSPLQMVGSNVIAAAAGWQHTLFIKGDTTLWGTGQNGSGELGLGQGVYGEIDIPQALASNVVAAAAGEESTLFIKSDGSLWGMGDEGSGELGDGTYGQSPYMTVTAIEQIMPGNAAAVAMGTFHSLLLEIDGSLWAAGDNEDGQLGDGTSNINTNRFEMIVPSNVVVIAAGYDHSLFIKSDGSLWAMGYNYDGELGDGTSDNGVYHTNRPEMILSSNVTAVAGGGNFSLFLKSDGSLWGMGNNAYGQLGLESAITSTNAPVLIVPGPLAITSLVQSGTNIIINASGGLADTPIKLLTSTNPATPLPQWTPVATNTLSAYGYFSMTATNGFNLTNAAKYFALTERVVP